MGFGLVKILGPCYKICHVIFEAIIPDWLFSHELIWRHNSSNKAEEPKEPRWQLRRAVRTLVLCTDFFLLSWELWRLLRTDDTRSFFPVCGPPWRNIKDGTFGFPDSNCCAPRSRRRRRYSFSRQSTAIITIRLSSRRLFWRYLIIDEYGHTLIDEIENQSYIQ